MLICQQVLKIPPDLTILNGVQLHLFFFFNDTATTEIYTLSLHDALPIWLNAIAFIGAAQFTGWLGQRFGRSEEHTSELQSHSDLVCRLLLEKKKEDVERQQKHLRRYR